MTRRRLVLEVAAATAVCAAVFLALYTTAAIHLGVI